MVGLNFMGPAMGEVTLSAPPPLLRGDPSTGILQCCQLLPHTLITFTLVFGPC